ncbi:MAG: hypothetical protein H6636_03485 [Anaerolineales bacterium]|nr:hypothetical protein [Anaerolineales bacterium]
MNEKLFILLITCLTLAGSFAFPRPTYACSCVAPGTPLQELANVDAVFIGKVMGGGANPIYTLQNYLAQYVPFLRNNANGSRRYSFYVVQSWKGVDQNAITIQTGSGDADCGYTFTPTQDYLVYARRAANGNYTTSICSRTTEMAYAASDMIYLSGLPLLQLRNTYHPNQPLYLCVGVTSGLVLILLGFAYYHRKKRTSQTE